MVGERLQPVLPRLAALQRDGAVTVEKVQIVERAMQKLTRPGLHPEAVEIAEQLLTDYAPVLGPTDLRRYALAWSMLPIPTAQNQSTINCNKTAGIWNSSAGMACGTWQANSPPRWVPS